MDKVSAPVDIEASVERFAPLSTVAVVVALAEATTATTRPTSLPRRSSWAAGSSAATWPASRPPSRISTRRPR
jgi:hypothetical protein